jgi:hypothetical protein
VAAVALIGLAVFLVELVRRRQLKEKYSLLWFATVTVLAVLTLKRSWLGSLANAVGIYYPPSALFLVLVGFLLLIQVHYSTVENLKTPIEDRGPRAPIKLKPFKQKAASLESTNENQKSEFVRSTQASKAIIARAMEETLVKKLMRDKHDFEKDYPINSEIT